MGDSAPSVATISGTDNPAFLHDPEKAGGGDEAVRRSHSSVDFATLPDKRESRARSVSSVNSHTGPYRGMGKEELLRYSSQPFWRNLRYLCMSVVLVGWLALLITVVALVLTYPQCRGAEPRDWWQTAAVYRVYLRSYYDGHKGDGIGDLKGLRLKLDYIKDLGVDTVSVSPFYQLSGDDVEDTNIVDHKAVDPLFGDLAEFRQLVNDTHNKDMRLIIDFIPNHTSDKHHWFVNSSANSNARDNEYRSYYVWQKGQNSTAPNNWRVTASAANGSCSAWSHGGDDWWFLHQHSAATPDLNLRSDKVKDELKAILKFWLDLGVDGFYVRDADYLIEDFDFRDEPGNSDCSELNTSERPYTRGADGNLDLLAHWRAYLDQLSVNGSHKVLVTAVDGQLQDVVRYYGLFARDGADLPLNTPMAKLDDSSTGLGALVRRWMDATPTRRWPSWLTSDDQLGRLASRLDAARAKAVLVAAMLLPGTPTTLYGDELGMQDVGDNGGANWGNGRGVVRWDAKNVTKFGFCHHEHTKCEMPWLVSNPIGNSSMDVPDAESQMGAKESFYHVFRNLTSLRREPAFLHGTSQLLAPATDADNADMLAFVRELDGEKGYLVAVNLGASAASAPVAGLWASVPDSAGVEMAVGLDKGVGSVGLAPLSLPAGAALVASWDFQPKEL